MTDETFLVVGAGHAGGRAVEAMRMSGFEGNITLVGTERHLPYERPPLSKELLQQKPGVEFQTINDATYYDDQNIELHLGVTVTEIDTDRRLVRFADGDTIGYNKLLLTTGAEVRPLHVPGAELGGVYYLRTLHDSQAIDARLEPGAKVVVIGGGFIGLEVAASARMRGCEVTVIEMADRLMNRAIGPAMANAFLALHREHDVDVRLNTGVERLEGTSEVERVVTSGETSYEADLVVVGIGVSPETALAESAGLTVDNGIVVDQFCQTSAPDVFAAGDATNHFNPILRRHVRLESWQNAQNQAIAAAGIMCGKTDPYAEVPWFWSDQYDANLQTAGLVDNWLGSVFRGDPDSHSFMAFVLADDEIVAVAAFNRPRDMRFVRRMMGVGRKISVDELTDESNALKDLAKG